MDDEEEEEEESRGAGGPRKKRKDKDKPVRLPLDGATQLIALIYEYKVGLIPFVCPTHILIFVSVTVPSLVILSI